MLRTSFHISSSPLFSPSRTVTQSTFNWNQPKNDIQPLNIGFWIIGILSGGKTKYFGCDQNEIATQRILLQEQNTAQIA